MNTFGRKLTLTTFGESHAAAIGGVLDGFPAGVRIDLNFIQSELDKRKPGGSKFATARSEGDLSKLRAALVNEKSFAELAKYLNLGQLINISPAEEHNGGRLKASILSDAFEALMGAIYLESGFDAVRAASLKAFERCYPDINFDRMVKDYKTALQELTQARFAEIPKYVLVGSKGPDHKKEFEIALMLNEREISRAAGKSKKEAEQKAAKTALEILGEGK